jgi:hypothetical protein
MFKKNNRFQIKTPTGFENFAGVQKKVVDCMYTIELHDGTFLKCSSNHAVLCETGFVFAKDLKITNTLTNKKIKNISFVEGKFEVFDPVGVDNHSSYYSNGVVSHNTEFLGSTNTLISGTKLQQMAYQPPIAEHEMLKIYKQPIKGEKPHLYGMFVDVSEGKGLDSSTFSVIDLTTMPYEQVATYKSSSVSPLLFPTYIHDAARLYNDAYVLVEVNNTPQVADILHQDLEYENLWKIFTGNKKPQQLSAGFARGVQMGLKMSTQVKRIGCSNLKTLIEGNKLVINDFDTISELTTFVANKSSFAAEEDANDDMVMGLVMFSWATTQKYFREIVAHDVRKQLQLETMNQYDEETLPAPIIEDGLEHDFMVEGGDVWEKADSGETYAGYVRELHR